jgi:hypothetical protein
MRSPVGLLRVQPSNSGIAAWSLAMSMGWIAAGSAGGGSDDLPQATRTASESISAAKRVRTDPAIGAIGAMRQR